LGHDNGVKLGGGGKRGGQRPIKAKRDGRAPGHAAKGEKTRVLGPVGRGWG